MAYTKTIWENDITPVSASNMNKIEDQMEIVSTKVDTIEDQLEIYTATISGSTGALYLYRSGNVVFFSSNGAFRSSGSSLANGTTLSQTIPNGFRPANRAYIMSVAASNNWRLEITTAGGIIFYGTTAWDGNMYISGLWITNNSIPT